MISFAVFSEGIIEMDDYDEDAKGLVEPPYSSDISLPSASIYDFDFEWLLERKRSCVEILTEYYGFSEAKLVEDMVDSAAAKEGTEDFVVFIDEAGDSVRCEISFVTDRYFIFSFNRQPI
jgi:hypothetical protein